MAIIGVLIMSWQQVILAVSCVSAGVVLALNNRETLAATLIGGVVGYLAQPRKSQTYGPNHGSQSQSQDR